MLNCYFARVQCLQKIFERIFYFLMNSVLITYYFFFILVTLIRIKIRIRIQKNIIKKE